MLISRSTFFHNPEKAQKRVSELQHKKRLHSLIIRLTEAAVWLIVIAIVVTLRIMNVSIFNDESTLWLTGLIIAFALAYYTVISRNFNKKQAHYIKDIADVIFIGVLSTLAKDYSVYFFALYILPIAGAAFALNILNSLLIAVFASLFIAANIILNTQFFGSINPVYLGTFQILFLILLTFFTRALALQLRTEQTERSLLEKKLAHADKKLEDLEAIEQEFVTMTTHQLNTPLSIIRGYSSLLLDGDAGKLNTKQKKYAKEINDGSHRLANLIQDLLSIAHIDNHPAKDHEHVLLQPILRSSTDILSEKLQAKDVHVSIKSTSTKLHVVGNKSQLEQVLANLVDNAIKYSDAKSTIILTLEKEDSRAIITVTDQGIGIPKAEQSRIFQRFYRASNSKERDTRGTGLGLYIVKRVIEDHGGTIRFDSKANVGTTFTITLPLASNNHHS